jgi:hypothetical protein
MYVPTTSGLIAMQSDNNLYAEVQRLSAFALHKSIRELISGTGMMDLVSARRIGLGCNCLKKRRRP